MSASDEFKAALDASYVAAQCLSGALLHARAVGDPSDMTAILAMSEACGHAATLSQRLQDVSVVMTLTQDAKAGAPHV